MNSQNARERGKRKETEKARREDKKNKRGKQDRARYYPLETACGIPEEQFHVLYGHNASDTQRVKPLLLLALLLFHFVLLCRHLCFKSTVKRLRVVEQQMNSDIYLRGRFLLLGKCRLFKSMLQLFAGRSRLKIGPKTTRPRVARSIRVSHSVGK